MSTIAFAIRTGTNELLWSTFAPTPSKAIQAFEQDFGLWEPAKTSGHTLVEFTEKGAFDAPVVNVDWELYDKPECQRMAQLLNTLLADHVALSRGRGFPLEDRANIEKSMLDVMESYASFGAADSEPRRALATFLDKTFRV